MNLDRSLVLASASPRRQDLLRQIVAAARVFQGGGSELPQPTLEDRLREAANDSLIRLFPRFTEADASAQKRPPHGGGIRLEHLTVASLAEGSRVLTATQHPHRLPPATQRIGIAYDPATGDTEVIAIEGESYRLKEANERSERRIRQHRKAKS